MELEKKEFQIDWEGKKEPVVIRKLTFGEMNDLYDDPNVIEQRIIGKIVNIRVKTGKLKELSMLKSIMKAPFKIDIQSIRDLPEGIGNEIFAEVDKLSNLSEKKGLISGGQSKPETGPQE